MICWRTWLVSFEQVVDNVLVLYQNSNGSGEYRTNYDMFIVSGDLIADTSSDYYSLITASMSDHRDTMEMLQNLDMDQFHHRVCPGHLLVYLL